MQHTPPPTNNWYLRVQLAVQGHQQVGRGEQRLHCRSTAREWGKDKQGKGQGQRQGLRAGARLRGTRGRAKGEGRAPTRTGPSLGAQACQDAIPPLEPQHVCPPPRKGGGDKPAAAGREVRCRNKRVPAPQAAGGRLVPISPCAGAECMPCAHTRPGCSPSPWRQASERYSLLSAGGCRPRTISGSRPMTCPGHTRTEDVLLPCWVWISLALACGTRYRVTYSTQLAAKRCGFGLQALLVGLMQAWDPQPLNPDPPPCG